MICIVMSPVGPYFPTGLQPISLFIDEQNVRAWPGGVGANKVGTNYAPTIGPQTDAAAEYGTSQVIYSFPQGSDPEDALVSECGSMNMMFFIQKVSFALRCVLCLRQADRMSRHALRAGTFAAWPCLLSYANICHAQACHFRLQKCTYFADVYVTVK